MTVTEGRSEFRLSTTFASTEAGIKDIQEKITNSFGVRMNSVPLQLIQKLAPFLKGKEKNVRIILSPDDKPTEEVISLGRISSTKARVCADYKGIDANLGSIYFNDRLYEITWTKERVIEIESKEYDKCVKCMGELFENAWKNSSK
jgi:hypothetical protein